jgi:hypothetical protein
VNGTIFVIRWLSRVVGGQLRPVTLPPAAGRQTGTGLRPGGGVAAPPPGSRLRRTECSAPLRSCLAAPRLGAACPLPPARIGRGAGAVAAGALPPPPSSPPAFAPLGVARRPSARRFAPLSCSRVGRPRVLGAASRRRGAAPPPKAPPISPSPPAGGRASNFPPLSRGGMPCRNGGATGWVGVP